MKRFHRKSHRSKRLKRTIVSNSRNYYVDRVKDHYHIKDYTHGTFIPINDAPKSKYYKGPWPSYGGAQVWWSNSGYRDSTGNDYGCGVIASANLIFYLSQHFEDYKCLCQMDNERTCTYDHYMRVADELWGCLKPYSGFDGVKYLVGRDPYTKRYPLGFGVTAAKLIRGLKAYAQKRAVDIDFEMIKAIAADDRQAADFIIESLSKNIPVLLLSLKNGIECYEFHWVMITEMKVSEHHKNDQVTISTWGCMKEGIDFDKLWKSFGFIENQYLVRVKDQSF